MKDAQSKRVMVHQMSMAALDVVEERRRQIEVEGYRCRADDGYVNGELAKAASAYCDSRVTARKPGKACYVPMIWPWSMSMWKPKDRRSNLVKAGALILAEIERLDRIQSSEAGG